MICAWQGLLSILPVWMRNDVNKYGKECLTDLRLRRNARPQLHLKSGLAYLERTVNASDLQFCVNAASRYSPWTAATAASGYITAPGGHRIGLCGDFSGSTGSLTSTNGLTSLCIRIARDFPGIATNLPSDMGSVLIIGRPGSGKTTLLRDLIRHCACERKSVAVVDEREEIFPNYNGTFYFETGNNVDVLSSCKKSKGIDLVLRTMGPGIVAIDEITAAEDCIALLQAGWCGVDVLATAHAGNKPDLMKRPLYKPILESKIFDTLLILNENRTWTMERLNI